MTPSESKTKTTKKSRYTASPHLPAPAVPIYDAMVRVMSGTVSVTTAADELEMARNQFQTCLHKAQRAFIAALPAGRTGRPKASEAERRAKATIAAQRRALARMTREKSVLEARLHAASELIRAEMTLASTTARSTSSRPRSRRSRSTSATATSTKTTSSDEDGEGARARMFALVGQLESLGCRRAVASRSAGLAPSTMRRWRRLGPPRGAQRTRPRPSCNAPIREAVEALVRQSKGRFGCEAIRHRVGSVSRRDVAAIKVQTRTAMERERKDEATRVVVSLPGIVRGFDAMHLATHDGSAFALRSQDAAIPFTTSLFVATGYDATSVVRALERDFAEHGAPYILRFDRASVHRTDEVTRMLDASGVLVLHGPPRCPRFYGQLERTHVDLRAFAPAGMCRTIAEHASALERGRVLLNREWCRRSLDYNTAEQRWNARSLVALSRGHLREQVLEIERRIREKEPRLSDDEYRRFAIQAALIRHQLLRLVPGGYR